MSRKQCFCSKAHINLSTFQQSIGICCMTRLREIKVKLPERMVNMIHPTKIAAFASLPVADSWLL